MLISLSAILGTAENYGGRKAYIVHILKSMKPQHFDSHHHWYASMLDQIVQSDPSAKEMLYTYDTLLHGFAARLSKAEAQAMEAMDGCLAVIPSSLSKISTTHTPEFLGLSSSGLWSRYSTYGKDIIVGMIDTGIWPESKSFKDEGLGPAPTGWKGACESGRGFDSSNCNGKIIGARYFSKGYEAQNPTPINETLEYKSPRDNNGHGTHTASTVAGAAVSGISYFGFANGTARGMAPQARLAIYKACWADGCYDTDTVAAMEQAIADGVDIISISIGSRDRAFYNDNKDIAAFGAIEKGVFVSASAGNDGPSSSTLGNVAPWITTVGASSIDRDFPASVLLGNKEMYKGTSTYTRVHDATLQRPFPLFYVSTNISTRYCLSSSLEPNLVRGKIVVCNQISSYEEVARAGGAGIIGANERRYGSLQRITNPNTLPAVSVSFTTGEKIKAYINNTGSNATATMSLKGLTVLGKETTAPMVAAFSSRGPSKGYPQVLKPDIIAPGLNILAAYTKVLPYNILSGTSMSCPHVSGIAALVKAIHPTWSPAAIKSALMTSSYLIDNAEQPIKDSFTVRATNPFVLGAGHVDPNAAVDPGLVYDMAPQDYITFLCSLNYTKQQIALLTKKSVSCPNSSLEAGDLNYPSFSVVMKSGSKSFQVKKRTVTYVGREGDAVYRVSVNNPAGITISVEPQTLKFRKPLETASYSVKLEGTVAAGGGTAFGQIMWKCTEGGSQIVRSPVAVNIEA
ncbi:subtilisin-like protease SBT1.4 [Cryptomeria japonica]|uniref:subtilisin-like protease SBT1.4 n=1 Tax=Cryptomeria japonica TaxID=3369 RepID=UPI0027DA2E5D|nr:subtilisin-like protease SBT1.4 [Cryptomeria japonica]